MRGQFPAVTFPAMSRKHAAVVLVVGLDNSGKTSVVDRLAAQTSGRSAVADDADGGPPTLPTVGFAARRFQFRSTPVTVLDMSGQVRVDFARQSSRLAIGNERVPPKIIHRVTVGDSNLQLRRHWSSTPVRGGP